MPDKVKIKADLEKERDGLLGEMHSIGKLNTDTGEWEAVPEEFGYQESDQNDMADRFEDFESRSSMLRVLEGRLNNVLAALKTIDKKNFALCKVCNNPIEEARLQANPAARTCKKHLES